MPESSVEQFSKKETESQYQFDAIVVHGAFMQKDKKTGQYKLPTIIQEDPGKVVGGHSRAIATAELNSKNITPVFLVGGGVQVDEVGNKTSRAEVLTNLIIDKYHVPREKVVNIGGIEGRGNTQGNINDVVDYFMNHPEILKLKKIGFLSNRWQLERSLLMFNDNPYFSENNIELVPIAVEDVLPERSKHYKQWVEKLESSPEMTHRKKMEEKGIKDFKSGKYKPLSS